MPLLRLNDSLFLFILFIYLFILNKLILVFKQNIRGYSQSIARSFVTVFDERYRVSENYFQIVVWHNHNDRLCK